MSVRRYRVALLIDYIFSEYANVLLDGIKKACSDLEMELLIFPIGELHNVQKAFDYQYVAVTGLLKSENIDGIIFAAGTQMHFLTKAEITSYLKSYKSLPLVSISIEIPGVSSIIVECENTYRELISNLIDVQKCKKFGVMGVRSNSSEVRFRTKVIKNILEERGVASKDVTFWKSSFNYSATIDELQAYYDTAKSFDFDAIICLNDEMAFGCIDFCTKLGLRVPEDVVVVGYDDIDRGKITSPTLTSINQRISDQGYQAALNLRKLIDEEEVEDITVIETKAYLRESSTRFTNPKKKSNYIFVDRKNHKTAFESFLTKGWYGTQDQLSQMSRFYSEMQYDMSQEQLRHRLNSDVKNFGISALGIVLYDTPIEMSAPFDYFTMPKKAQLFCGFDYKTGFDSSITDDVLHFNPSRTFFPEGLLQADSDGLYVSALFHNTLQYGYIIFRRGDYDLSIYDLLTKIISTILSSIYSFALVHNEHAKFQSKYDKLDIIANTDELTGLFNRRGLYEAGQTTLKFAKAMKQKGLIVYCDMDGLKKINDTYGHEAGDRAILAESIILKGNFRSNDVVSRIGGDEFVVISPGLDKENFERIKRQIEEDCKVWSETSNASFQLSISIGYIEYPSEKVGYQITPLLSEADSILYLEKRRKKALQNK